MLTPILQKLLRLQKKCGNKNYSTALSKSLQQNIWWKASGFMAQSALSFLFNRVLCVFPKLNGYIVSKAPIASAFPLLAGELRGEEKPILRLSPSSLQGVFFDGFSKVKSLQKAPLGGSWTMSILLFLLTLVIGFSFKAIGLVASSPLNLPMNISQNGLSEHPQMRIMERI